VPTGILCSTPLAPSIGFRSELFALTTFPHLIPAASPYLSPTSPIGAVYLDYRTSLPTPLATDLHDTTMARILDLRNELIREIIRLLPPCTIFRVHHVNKRLHALSKNLIYRKLGDFRASGSAGTLSQRRMTSSCSDCSTTDRISRPACSRSS